MTENDEFIVNYTNRDIMEKLEVIDEKLHAVHTMAKITNGNVKFHTKLIWGSFGFTFAVLVLLIGLISTC